MKNLSGSSAKISSASSTSKAAFRALNAARNASAEEAMS